MRDRTGNHNPDTYIETSAGYCEIDAESSPTGTYRGWYYITIKINNRSIWQIITQDNATSQEYYLRKSHGGTWSQWKQL